VLGRLVQLVLLAAVAVSPSALAGPKRVFVGAAHLAVILSSVVPGAAELTAIQTEAASLGSVHVSCVLRLSIVLGRLVQLVLLAAVAVSPSALAGPKRVFVGAAHLAVILSSVVPGAAELAIVLHNLDVCWLRVFKLNLRIAVCILSLLSYCFFASQSLCIARRDRALALARLTRFSRIPVAFTDEFAFDLAVPLNKHL